jgi:hypothetical protein
MGNKYHRIDFVVKVNLGPADICFELWHQGVKLSKDEAIKVDWVAAPPPDPQSHPVVPDFPISSLSTATGVARKMPVVGVQNVTGFAADGLNENGYYSHPRRLVR